MSYGSVCEELVRGVLDVIPKQQKILITICERFDFIINFKTKRCIL
jgi:hypothetical protein